MIIQKVIKNCIEVEPNVINSWYLKSRRSKVMKRRFLDEISGNFNNMWNVLVVKGWKNNEKGVLIIKYGEVFEGFMAFFDVPSILQKYYVVLEMSWAGSCDPSFLMYCNPKNTVFVQTPEERDFRFLKKCNSNIVPIYLGPGDWVDADLFVPPKNVEKIYDISMVAHWGKIKNHKLLFNALKKIERPLNILLIGFPWGNRTKEDVLREYNEILGHRKDFKLDLFEKLDHDQLKAKLARAKLQLLLTTKEGGNKSIPEGMFLNVPAIVYNGNVGGVRSKINEKTGLLSSFSELDKTIEYLIDHYQEFQPAEYINRTSGSANSTMILNQIIKEKNAEQKLSWTTDIFEKVNAPTMKLKNNQNDLFEKDYEYIQNCKLKT
jgi:glycosyltransferase involved in cell wall biosynthesis